MAWDGISNSMADFAYTQLANDIGKHGKYFLNILKLVVNGFLSTITKLPL